MDGTEEDLLWEEEDRTLSKVNDELDLKDFDDGLTE